MDSTVLGDVILAIPASIAAYSAWSTRRRVKTNHGKTIGQHVETGAEDARIAKEQATEAVGLAHTAATAALQAKDAVETVAADLVTYKAEQAGSQSLIVGMVEEHTRSDAENFVELRQDYAELRGVIVAQPGAVDPALPNTLPSTPALPSAPAGTPPTPATPSTPATPTPAVTPTSTAP